jgi:hypothetical protein
LSVGWHRALPNASSQLVGGYQNEGGEAETRDERRLLSVERMLGTLSVLRCSRHEIGRSDRGWGRLWIFVVKYA